MRISTLTLKYKIRPFKPGFFPVIDERGRLKYFGEFHSILSNKFSVCDQEGIILYDFIPNFFKSQCDIFNVDDGDQRKIGEIKASIGLKKQMTCHTSEGIYYLKANLLQKKFHIVDDNGEEHAMLVKKLSGLKHHYGMAIKDTMDPAIAIGIAIFLKVKSKK